MKALRQFDLKKGALVNSPFKEQKLEKGNYYLSWLEKIMRHFCNDWGHNFGREALVAGMQNSSQFDLEGGAIVNSPFKGEALRKECRLRWIKEVIRQF